MNYIFSEIFMTTKLYTSKVIKNCCRLYESASLANLYKYFLIMLMHKYHIKTRTTKTIYKTNITGQKSFFTKNLIYLKQTILSKMNAMS